MIIIIFKFNLLNIKTSDIDWCDNDYPLYYAVQYTFLFRKTFSQTSTPIALPEKIYFFGYCVNLPISYIQDK